MKNLLVLSSIIIVLAVSCKKDEEDSSGNNTGGGGGGGGGSSLTSTSPNQYQLVTGSTTLTGQVNSASESYTSNDFSIGDPISDYIFGWGLINYINDARFIASTGPYSSMGLPATSAFYAFFQEGAVQEVGYGPGQWQFTYNNASGVTFSTEDFDQTGSTITIVDSQPDGSYMRVYATFSCKLFSSGQITTGHFVGLFVRD